MVRHLPTLPNKVDAPMPETPQPRFLRPVVWILVLALAACAPRQYRLETTGAGQGLSRVTSEEFDELRPALSPDGSWVLFDAPGDDGRVVVGVDPRNGARRTIYTGSSSSAQEVAWGPEGAWFTYTTNAPGSWSLVRSITSTPNAAIAVLVSGELAPEISNPNVSPTGETVAFQTAVRGRWQIAQSTLDGSDFTILGDGIDPEWSPDGQRLVFSRNVGGWWHIFTIDARSGSQVVQVTTGESDNLFPSWSPSGDRILFASNRGANKARKAGERIALQRLRGPFNLYTLGVDGTALVQVTDGDGMNLYPTWGRDGWIYFASNQAGHYDIWKLRAVDEAVGGVDRNPVGRR